jgi:PleD family two-component response regulator
MAQAGQVLKPGMLVREADKAMYDAKKKGGDQTILSSLESGKWVSQSLAVV